MSEPKAPDHWRPWFSDTSPITPLLPVLIGAAENIAPERREELAAILARVRIVVDDHPERPFRAVGQTDPRDLRLSVVGLEFLWAVSYATLVVYRTAKASNQTQLRFDDTEETATAIAMLRFALADRTGPENPRWALPPEFPAPRVHDRTEQGEAGLRELATEMLACAVGWSMHHELGHIVLDHMDREQLLLQDELDADRYATRWALDDMTDQALITKRGLGIVIGLLALVVLALAHGPKREVASTPTYPTTGERIMLALMHRAFGEDHVVYEFAAYSLKLFLEAFGTELPEGPFDTAFDAVYPYARALSAWERSLS